MGCALALGVGSAFEAATPYFLPFAGGMFLYLSLGCLLPEVLHVESPGDGERVKEKEDEGERYAWRVSYDLKV